MKLTEEKDITTMHMARIAYERYCSYTDNKEPETGEQYPKWENLPEYAINAWCAAVFDIEKYLRGERLP